MSQRSLGSGDVVDSQARQPSSIWWLISGLWILLTMATALQGWITQRAELGDSLRLASTLWLPWAIVTPVIVWLSVVLTLERHHWRKRLAVHLAVCATITILLGLLTYLAGPPPLRRYPPPGVFRPPPPPFSLVGVLLRRASFQLPIYWAIVGVAHAFIFHERARERERHAAVLESRLTKARLHGLQLQLNPHFLFNTLNSIASLIHHDPRVAVEMIGSLSEFFRVTLKTSDRAEVRLREELEYLDHYLSIEQIRFGERLRVEKQIDPAALDLLVPVLILQPLVENAIKHGIEKQIAPGVVRITAARSGDRLCLQVTDNGRGLRDSTSEEFKEGVGLSNIRARLSELAGAAAALELRTAPGGGVVAEIHLPCSQSTSIAPA